MKKKITIDKRNGKISFYLKEGKKTHYLFTQDFTKGVYDFFKWGRSENEVMKYRKWNTNPRLDKTIERIPMYVSYVMREEAAA